jgi:hypothetical protein
MAFDPFGPALLEGRNNFGDFILLIGFTPNDVTEYNILSGSNVGDIPLKGSRIDFHDTLTLPVGQQARKKQRIEDSNLNVNSPLRMS